MRSNLIEVRYDGRPAGILSREGNKFIFKYDSGYDGMPVSSSLPLSPVEYVNENVPHPFFMGLSPQGWYKETLLAIDKIDRNDPFTMLAVNGIDLPGAVETVAKDLEIEEPERLEGVDLDKLEVPGKGSLNAGCCLVCNESSEADYHGKCLGHFFNCRKEPAVMIKSSDFTVRMYKNMRRTSMSGMQAKVGAEVLQGVLRPSTAMGRFILKPPIMQLPSSAVNEFLSMKICENILGKGKVAECALVKLADDKLGYVTKRFDRTGPKVVVKDGEIIYGESKASSKVHMEDLGQLLGEGDQFASSYEEVAGKITEVGSKILCSEFLQSLLVQFYIGNTDMHLKNIALLGITKKGTYRRLAPIYDCLNTESILRGEARVEETALSFFKDDYELEVYLSYGHSSYQTFSELYKRSGFNDRVLDMHLKKIVSKHEDNVNMVSAFCLMDDEDREDYLRVLDDRLKKLRRR